MSITRKWYAYNDSPGGQQDQANYFFVDFFPSCDITGNNICAVLGIYEIKDSVDPSKSVFYGNHPQSFLLDKALGYYINVAMAQPSSYPSGTGQKPYVYKKSII
jgi:hypothetical protein